MSTRAPLGKASLQSDRLSGKTALVTGSGSGIGRGCALMFARHGAEVMATDLNANTAAQTVTLAEKEGLSIGNLSPIDLTKPQDVQRLMEGTLQRFGRLDVLVNAG